MTANTRQSSNINGNPPPAPSPEASPNKTSIRMAAHGPLTALHALAKSYRDMMDLLKETRKDSIKVLNSFIKQSYDKAWDAAKDSKKALYMQAGASFVGGTLSIAGAAANAVSGSAEKQRLNEAAAKKDFLEGIKRDLSGTDLNLSVANGAVAGQQGNIPTANTSRAMTLIREGNFDELYRCNKLVAPGGVGVVGNGHLTDNEISDAAKFISAGTLPLQLPDAPAPVPVLRADVIKNVTDQVIVQSNVMNVNSNDLGRLDARNKGMVDLAQGVQQGGFAIRQGQLTETSRQEEAEVSKLSQLQKMADQTQTDFSESNKQLSRDLASISEQVGRIIPMRG